MSKLLSGTLLVSLLLLSACVPAAYNSNNNEGLKPVAEYEGGKLYRAGEVNVLELTGDYHQMGRQYGKLLKNVLNELYVVSINKQYIQKQGFTYERLKVIAYSIFDLYPQRYKEILYGMAETSGLGLEKQVILNAIEWYPKINNLVPKCSGIAVWGDYTRDGTLIFGRNNDDSAFFKEFGKYMVVTVFKAADSSINAAIINYAGVIYAPSGINGEGIFLELNSGNWMGYYPDRASIFVTLLSFLQDYSSIEGIDAAFQAVRVNLSSIVNVADKDIAYSFECPTNDVKRRVPDKEGLLAATNHFIHPAWNIPQPADDEKEAWTVKRRDNLLAMGEKYKGQFDVEKMKQVMDTTIENGGATVSTDTIYQIIAIPGDLVLWLKAPGNFDWQKISLSKLLNS